MIHYHGTPITPQSILQTLTGRHFCVSFANPQNLSWCLKHGQSVLGDNGAWSLNKLNPRTFTYPWDAYYSWVRRVIEYPQNWCIIPDVIGGTEAENDRLIQEWPLKMGSYRQAAPVWHVHESLYRLERMVSTFERVCFGSSGEYWTVGSDKWNNRMNEVFNFLCKGSGSPQCWIHMLRGMSLAGSIYPFASVDSTDVAQNHKRPQNTAREMAEKWDAQQCPSTWTQQPLQQELLMNMVKACVGSNELLKRVL